MSMQAPWQSCFPLGHAPPHERPSHVAIPSAGTSQGVQEVPQVLVSVSETQPPGQVCWPGGHSGCATSGWASRPVLTEAVIRRGRAPSRARGDALVGSSVLARVRSGCWEALERYARGDQTHGADDEQNSREHDTPSTTPEKRADCRPLSMSLQPLLRGFRWPRPVVGTGQPPGSAKLERW